MHIHLYHNKKKDMEMPSDTEEPVKAFDKRGKRM